MQTTAKARALAITIALFSLFSCGGGSGSDSNNDNNEATNPAPSLTANNDQYRTFGNTLLELNNTLSSNIAVKLVGSVLDNDTDPDLTNTLSVLSVGTPQFGSVTMTSEGHFTYTPPVAASNSTDTFTYELSNGTQTDTGTVTITIDHRIWYIDNRNTGGLGTSSSPFSNLADAEQVIAESDVIYIMNGDGTKSGLDTGLVISHDNVSVIGEGQDLTIDGLVLQTAGISPTITNNTGAAIRLTSANNIQIAGLNIDAALSDSIVIDATNNVSLDNMAITNSGESAIDVNGTDISLSLQNVVIDGVDTVDPLRSDDGITITVSNSLVFTMLGGSVNDVPGSLGDGISIENPLASNAVAIDVNIRGISMANIEQDGIKIDTANGLVNAQIGGADTSDSNELETGFRGIQIQTGVAALPHQIAIENNIINSQQDAIQLRSVSNASHINITNNLIESNLLGEHSDSVDVQAEFTSASQARINGNRLKNIDGNSGIKIQVYDGASLTVESLDNTIDGAVEGFNFDVLDTTASTVTALNATVQNNIFSGLGQAAMRSKNHHSTSETCLDLQNNNASERYIIDAVIGIFELTTSSQSIEFDPVTGSANSVVQCSTPNI